MAVGALEPQFYAALLAGLGLADAGLPGQHDRDGWPDASAALRRDVRHPHQGRVGAGIRRHRRLRVARCSAWQRRRRTRTRERGRPSSTSNGVTQPAPAPRFGRTAASQPAAPPRPGADTDDVLAGLGLSAAEVSGLRARGVVG